ncbi:Autophagy-related protein LC3 C [Intoshia linei]|uniref:Autophagy-related protein LC3 C n=1 Tax=Intoshia linei TaxID=1819745 RepID=A0A177AY40_9BILA|nr:Autophagy-related protein LC3 C [Intoshia linei]
MNCTTCKTNCSAFKHRRDFETRLKDAQSIIKEYPGKIPVIIERLPNEKHLPNLDRAKFLIPKSVKVLDLLNIIRRRLQLHPNQAFYLLVNNKSIVTASQQMAELYDNERDEDGFLYVLYAAEETFG